MSTQNARRIFATDGGTSTNADRRIWASHEAGDVVSCWPWQRSTASVAGIVGHMDPDDKPIDATADPVDKPAEDTVLFSDDAVVQAEPFIQTNIS